MQKKQNKTKNKLSFVSCGGGNSILFLFQNMVLKILIKQVTNQDILSLSLFFFFVIHSITGNSGGFSVEIFVERGRDILQKRLSKTYMLLYLNVNLKLIEKYTHTHTHTHICFICYNQHILYVHNIRLGFPGGSISKESDCNAGDMSSITGSRKPLEK